MLFNKNGKVIKPLCYKGWYAEIAGDSDNTV